MIKFIYKLKNTYLPKVIEGVIINLICGGIYMTTDFFTSYQFYTMIVIFLFSCVIVYWLEKSGINEAFFNWLGSKNITIRIFEANEKLTVKEFVRNLHLCTKKKLELTENELKDKLYKTCNYLITNDDKTATTEKRLELIWRGNEDEELYITPDGFEKWIREAKIRLP